jgi:hypothetical protein
MNNNLIIKEVTSNIELEHFINFADNLYKKNKYYIPQIKHFEIQNLNAEKKAEINSCKVKYWLAYRNNHIVGRVAGIINEKHNKVNNKKNARFGWLDCIDNKDTVILLLKEVENWARSEKMDTIHGPLGFNSFDPSGILIDGFEEIPTSFGKYNYNYYPRLIEEAGYTKDVDWVEYNVKVPQKLPQNVSRGANLIKDRYQLSSFTPKTKKELLKYSNQLFKLLNSTYKDIYLFSEIEDKQKTHLVKQFLPLIKLDFISLVIDNSDRLIGFGIAIPSYSKALQKANGNFSLFVFIAFFAKHFNKTADMLLIGIDEKYKNKGINSLIFNDIIPSLIKNGITNIETTRELEYNKSVNNLWKKYDTRCHKRSRCYIKRLKE